MILNCPICRTENIIQSTQKKVFGISEKCKICLTNVIEVYLPTCGHTSICIECAHSLDKNDKQDYIDDEDDVEPGAKDEINDILGSTIEDLKSKVDSLESQLSSIESEIQSANSNISDVQSSVDNL